jgi:hypothetical protein
MTILLNEINIARDKLKQLAKRKRNWDGNGAIPASKEILENASKFLDMVISEYKPLPTTITMTALGQITFAFPSAVVVRIEDFDILSWYVNSKSDEVFDGSTLPSVFESL